MEEGGLGIRDTRAAFNSALLAKWRWRMVSNEQGKWTDILLSKYGLELDWSQTSVKFQSRWWRDLCSVCGDGEEEGWFRKAIRWKVCYGIKQDFGRMFGLLPITLLTCTLGYTLCHCIRG